MCLTTLLLPYYAGAAVLAVLFPLCILLACASDPAAIHGEKAACIMCVIEALTGAC